MVAPKYNYISCILFLQLVIVSNFCLSQKINFLFPQRQHSINTSLRLHSHILIQLDLFSALTADAIIDIHQGCQFHIVAYAVLLQRIKFLVRALVLKMLNNAVLCSDNKFFGIAFLGIFHNSSCTSDIICHCRNLWQTLRMNQ